MLTSSIILDRQFKVLLHINCAENKVDGVMYIFIAGVHINQCLSVCGRYVGHMQMKKLHTLGWWVLALVYYLYAATDSKLITQVFSYKRKYMIIELILATNDEKYSGTTQFIKWMLFCSPPFLPV